MNKYFAKRGKLTRCVWALLIAVTCIVWCWKLVTIAFVIPNILASIGVGFIGVVVLLAGLTVAFTIIEPLYQKSTIEMWVEKTPAPCDCGGNCTCK
jgi:hypothetical protein